MIILKLGGSVITDKGTYATLNREVVESISKELAGVENLGPMIIVHGAGSFGHILAKQYSLKDPRGKGDVSLPIAEVQRDVRDLNLRLIQTFTSHGIPAVSLPPAAVSELDDGELTSFDTDVFRKFVDQGTIPVTFGDVVIDKTRGVSILSGDTIMERLAEEFSPEIAIFVLDVDGFYDRPPTESGAALYGSLSAEDLKDILSKGPVSSKDMNEVVDITGSILGKMESSLRIAQTGTDTYLVNGRESSRIKDILDHEPTISTIIKGVQ